MLLELSLDQAIELVELDNADIVDVRGPSLFAHGHQPGSLSIPYSRKGLDNRINAFISPERPVIFVVEDDAQVLGVTEQYEDNPRTVLGFLRFDSTGGVGSKSNLATIQEVMIDEINELANDEKYMVLDVREPIEWEMGHVPNATLISLSKLMSAIPDFPRNVKIIAICESGIRSSSAASVLLRAGLSEIGNVLEGTSGYRSAGFPLEFTRPTDLID